MNHTAGILEQGKALVRVMEILETIKVAGPLEETATRFLLQVYRRRLHATVASAPTWVSEEILSASQHIDEDRPAVWMSKN